MTLKLPLGQASAQHVRLGDTLGEGGFQKLTARGKTPVVSPSEVPVLCSGQFPITSRSLSCTNSAVLLEDMIAFHMVIAALWDQSSVSGWYQTSQGGLRHSTMAWAAAGT